VRIRRHLSAYTHPRPRKSAGTDRTVMLARPLKTERTLTHAPSRGTRTVRRSRRDVTLSLARTSYQCIIPIDHASSRFTLLRSGGLRCACAPTHSAITPQRRPCRTPLAQAPVVSGHHGLERSRAAPLRHTPQRS
jgi:hypothetical protein